MQSVYCSLSLSPTHTHTQKANRYTHLLSHKLKSILKTSAFLSSISALFSCSPNRSKELHKCQLSIVSPNPKLTKESASVHSLNKADGYQSLQPSRPNPFTPNLQHSACTHRHAFPHPHGLSFSLNGRPATFLHSQQIGRPFSK